MIVVKWRIGLPGYWVAYLGVQRVLCVAGAETADEALRDAWLLWGGDLPAVIYPRVT